MTFPLSLDTFAAKLVQDLEDALQAVQVKVGVDGSADTDTIDYKVASLLATTVRNVGGEAIGGVKTFLSSPVVPTPTIATQAANKGYIDALLGGLPADASVVHKAGAETLTGIKTFTLAPLVPTPVNANEAVPKSYVDTLASALATDTTVVHKAGAETLTGLKTINPSVAAAVGLIVKGLASQSGDLQQWQDSAGTVVAAVQPAGNIRLSNVFDVAQTGPYMTMGAASLLFRGRSISQTPIIARGFAGQTADLQQWQDSAGVSLARVTSTGFIGVGTNPLYPLHIRGAAVGAGAYRSHFRIGDSTALAADTGGGINFTGIYNAAGAELDYAAGIRAAKTNATEGDYGFGLSLWVRPNGGNPAQAMRLTSTGQAIFGTAATADSSVTRVYIETLAAANVGLTVRGAASQSGDYLQLQNSAGTVLCKVDSTGSLAVAGNIRAGTASPLSNVGLFVSPLSAAHVVAVVRGFASQSADLSQWQNSAGSILTRITAGGTLGLNGATPTGFEWFRAGTVTTTSPTTFMVVGNSATTNKNLVLQAFPAQSASMQEWQDSAGVVMASVNAAGLLTLRQATANAAQFDLKDSTGASVAQIRGMAGANLGIGANSTDAITSGTYNVGIGSDTLTAVTTGYLNVGIGLNAGAAITLGFHNTAIGANSLRKSTGDPGALPGTTSTNNTAIGANAMEEMLSGHRNVAIGVDALWKETTGSWNTAIGVHALNSQVGVDGSTAVGYFALYANLTGTGNTAIGRQALGDTTASNNTGIGTYAGASVTTGTYNVAIGTEAMFNPGAVFANRTITGQNQTAVGALSGQQSATTNLYGSAFGYSALYGGTGAVALGALAEARHDDSVALGMQVETTAANQVAVEDRHFEATEIADPAAPATDAARWYVRDNGSGKTQFCVRFATGAVQVLATEP